MMMKNLKKSIVFCFILMMVSSCYKAPEVVLVIDSNFSQVLKHSAKVTVSFSLNDDLVVSQGGILYSEIDTPVLVFDNYYIQNYTKTLLGTFENNSCSIKMEDLEDNGYYYCRPFVVVEGKPYYGETKRLNTYCPGMGQGPAGGYKFYDDGNGGGFEAAPYDIITDYDSYSETRTFEWGCYGSDISGTLEDLGAGYANSQILLSECNGNSVAKLCDDYSFNGYDDWYLPSLEELELMYSNLHANEYGKFHAGTFASSSVYSLDFVRGVDFSSSVNNSVGLYQRNKRFYIRPIRKF